MTVKVSKPAINVRSELSELRKPSGTAGEAMLRAETPQEQQALIGVGRRNVIINGGFDVWQRGTSATATSFGYATADRWAHNSSGGTLNLSRQELTVGQTSVPVSLKYFYRLNATTGDNNAGLWQKIEGVDRVQGDITISFYAKGANPAGGKFEIELGQYFGSTGSSQVNTTIEFSITSEWKRYLITLTLPSITGKTISGTDDYFRFYFRQPENDTTTTAWTLDFTGVQLELGKVATPFEHRSYGEELALCQRYYWRQVHTSTDENIGVSSAYNTQDAYAIVHHPVTMRSAPSFSSSAASTFKMAGDSTTYTATVVAGFNMSKSTFSFQLRNTGITQGNSYLSRFSGAASSSNYIELDAEL